MDNPSKPPPADCPTFSKPDAARIGLLSDTHVPGKTDSLPPEIYEIFADVDLILHAGDISTPGGLARVEAVAETLAVRGNHRGDRILFDPPLPERAILEAARGIRLGLVHGMRNEVQHATDTLLGRSGFVRLNNRRIVNRITPWFRGVDGIVFGHAHWPIVRMQNGTLLVNPGRAFGNTLASCGLMEIRERGIRVKLFPLARSGRFDPVLSRWHVFPHPRAASARSS